MTAAAAAASIAAAQSASAQYTPVNNWIGPATGNWADAANWDAGSAPDIDTAADPDRQDDVFFNGSTNLSITLPTNPEAGRLTITNTGTTTLTGTNLVLRGGGVHLATGAGAFSLSGSTNLNGNNQTYSNNSVNTLTISGDVNNVNNSSNVTFTVDGSGPTVISGGIKNSGGSPTPATTNLQKTGSGSLTLGAGTFLGNIQMDSGALLLRSANALGTSAKTVNFNGGTISAFVSARTIPSAIQWVLGGDVGFGGFGATLQIDGPLDLGGAVRTIDVGTAGGGTGNVSFVGAVSNGGIIKTGPNTITSNSSSTYAGGTTVNQGIVQFQNTTCNIVDGVIASGPFGMGTVTLNDSATFRSNQPSARTLQNNVVVNGTVTLGAVAPDTQTGALTFNSTDGTDTLTTPATFTLGTTPTLNVLVPTTIANEVVGSGGLTKAGAGTLTLSAANSYGGGTTVNVGTLVLGHADATAGGAINVADGALAQVQAALPKAVTVSTLATNTSGKLDLTNNSMVVKGMTDAQVRTQLQAGYNGGAWNGAAGIVSTAAAASTETSVGYASNASLGLTEFKGVSGLTGSDVIVKYTYAGDANLDGKVDIGDLGLLAGAWQQLSGKVWFDGDFTYDGAVNIGDLGLLAGNWQKGTVGNPSGPLMDFNTALAQFSAFNGVAVPEPTSLALLGLAGVGLLARRGRRRSA